MIHLARRAGLLGLTGGIAALGFVGVASAAPAGGAQQATTSRPDVVSAQVAEQPSITNAAGTPKVKVCFDQQITSPVFGNFAVSGADVAGTGNPLVATGTQTLPSELNCVNLTYPAGTNLAAYTTVEVKAGAVSPPGGGAGSNPQGAVALTGGDVAPGAGRISAPNLTGASVAAVAGGTEVTYTFDKLITQTGIGAPVAASFGYYNSAGAPIAAASVVAPGDRSVKVMFPTTVAATARVYVTNDAVKLAGQPDQGNAATATSGAGGSPPASGAPDLIGITRVATLQATYDLTYDTSITSNTELAARCQADTPSGRFAGTAVAVQGASTVRVTFGGLAASSRADEEIVRIDDTGGCVAANTLAIGSSVGAASIQNKDHSPGFTSGPDLTGCSAPAGGTDVTYTFDELLASGEVPAAGFGLIDADAVRTNGTGTVIQVTDNKATVRFASVSVLGTSVGCTVDRGAISDRRPGAEPSSLNTVKANSAGTPENFKPAPADPVIPKPGPGAAFVKRAPSVLGLNVSCHRIARGRVSCTTKGTLRPSSTLAPLGKANICTGTVRVKYTSGKKTLSSKTAKLSKTCTYRATAKFKASRKQIKALRVQARYGGNTVSSAKSSRMAKIKVRNR